MWRKNAMQRDMTLLSLQRDLPVPMTRAHEPHFGNLSRSEGSRAQTLPVSWKKMAIAMAYVNERVRNVISINKHGVHGMCCVCTSPSVVCVCVSELVMDSKMTLPTL